jgi:hypothetical protein
VISAKRILPFDSGGFDRYRNHVHPGLQKEDFELTPGEASVAQVVETFWGSNTAYFRHDPKTGLVFDPAHEALAHYYGLLTSKSKNYDARDSTIEVQFKAPFSVYGSLSGLIVPVSALCDTVIKFAQDTGVELKTYDFELPFYQNEFSREIRNRVRDFLEEGKLL